MYATYAQGHGHGDNGLRQIVAHVGLQGFHAVHEGGLHSSCPRPFHVPGAEGKKHTVESLAQGHLHLGRGEHGTHLTPPEQRGAKPRQQSDNAHEGERTSPRLARHDAADHEGYDHALRNKRAGYR